MYDFRNQERKCLGRQVLIATIGTKHQTINKNSYFIYHSPRLPIPSRLF